MLGVTPEMAFFFYSFFKLSIFCRSDEKFDGVCQQLHFVPRLRLGLVGGRLVSLGWATPAGLSRILRFIRLLALVR